ncbi:Esa1p-associated factor [Thecaphora frezii]
MLYSESEKVLCYHGPLIYSAKILKAEKWTGDDNATHQVGPHYLVHYDGWKKTWDEWVPESRLLKHNDENLAKKAGLEAAAKAGSLTASGPSDPKSTKADAKKSSAGGGGSAAAGGGEASERKSSTAARGTKRGREAVDHDEEYVKRPEIKIPIPDLLKVQLVDDWENVTKHEMLVKLPRKPTVNDILQDYKTHYLTHKKDSKKSPQVLDEVLKGLKLYFDRSLGQNLLYRLERAQLAKYRMDHGPKMGDGDISTTSSGDKTGSAASTSSTSSSLDALDPSNIYGAEHLLRLFVNLPMIIVHTSMDAESISVLKEHLAEFLAFMVKERSRLFTRDYETASASQQRLSNT